MQKSVISVVVLMIVLLAASLQRLHGTITTQPSAKSRSRAAQLLKDGNFAEALLLYQVLVEDSTNGGNTAADDLHHGVSCLQQLNRVNELDAFLETAVATHAENWKVLAATADLYNSVEHYGFLIGGRFHRGHHRGGGNQVSAQMRDRVRSLQLLITAMSRVQKSDNASPSEKAGVYFQLANVIGGPRHSQAWKLQDLTDLTTLPDYDKTARMHRWRGGFGGSPRGAPVDEKGEPVLYARPNSWETAKSDGERWRWALNQAAIANPVQQSEIDLLWAGFLQSQFGVRQQFHVRRAARQQDDKRPVEGLTLHTLTDTETLARLATGDRKLTLPAEFNHISVLQSVIDRQDRNQRQAIEQLTRIRMNRHQYPQAAELLRVAITLTRNGQARRQLQERISQIEDNWMQFESVQTQAAGRATVLDIRYRNGDQVMFTARPINIEQLLTDTRRYLESQPKQLDHNKLQIQNVGHRLIRNNQKKYLGKPVANWKIALQPPEGHFDGQESVDTPLKDAGAYWIEAKINDGNTSRIVLWVADTAIAKKHIEEGTLYYVADATTGKPVSQADLEFFGFRQERINRTRNHRIITSRFADRTDNDGLCYVSQQKRDRLQWVSIARTKEGRLAFEGFSNFWNPQKLSELHYSPTKVFTVTDRPVYRPEHKVQFRMWLRQPRFHEDQARYANQSFVLQISNPRGDVAEEHKVTTDQWGGIDGEWPIPADAVLGSYSLAICRDVNNKHKPVIGSGSFKVEEYRKPEFEVSIDAPDEPVKLGDTISATINARYYFGAPVTDAKVHYKVERSKKDSRWFPETSWDWLYSPGYWWFAPDTAWYPGWKHWGCFGPTPSWIGWNPDPPEVVSEGDATISEDGTFKVTIDTESTRQQHSDSDHSYRITAQVVDQSRRTISATGEVLVAREPFKVFVWTDKGHYQTGDTIDVTLQARTPDGKGVAGQGKATLYEVTWDNDVANEREVEAFELTANEDGSASLRMVIPKAGQYRISCSIADAAGNTQEGGQLVYVRGAKDNGRGYRFNDLELIVEKRNYQPGETAVLQINTNLPDSTVLLFVRPVNGVCPRPQVIRLTGKSTLYDLKVRPEDMPNFYVEALTIADGRMHSAMKEIFVPPTQKVANVEVVASEEEYRPGETAELTLKLTDENGLPFVGNTIITAYDASLEYVADNAIPEIRDFFWNVRRHHFLRVNSTLQRGSGPLYRQGEPLMQRLSDGSPTPMNGRGGGGRKNFAPGLMMKGNMMEMRAAPAASMEMEDSASADEAPAVEPTVRSDFSDTALWIASTDSAANGIVTAMFEVPDNLTTWKIKVWTLGEGTRAGSGTTDVICSKKLIIRPQTPRFFTEKDQITLSAIVHNYLDSAKDVEVILETEGGQLRHLTSSRQTVRVGAGGEARVDWPVQVVASGTATVRMKALTNEESDAAQLTVPAQIHGILKTESFAGVIRPGQNSAKRQLQVPAERIEQHSRLEIRYSPSLAGAMVDALPYLIEYPYGCTEQTLNRFLPAVLTQRTLLDMGLNLDDIRRKQTNLNAQEIGNPAQRKQRWDQHNPNPVFDADEMNRIVRDGVQGLTDMQLSDGGWGWFSGYGEHSSAHLTALVLHGLTVAKSNDVPVLPDVINRGVVWLKTHQAAELEKLREGDRRRKAGNQTHKRSKPYRLQAANMDALVAWVLSEHDGNAVAMTDYLYRDRLKLSVYGMCLSGLVLDTQKSHDRRNMVLQNIEQYLQQDNENQTAWLKLPGSNWWQWYGSENEAHSMYLRLLLKVRPKDEIASRIVKYLLNNRRAAGHWSSTRETALVIESLAEYIRATGEDRADMTIEVTIDGQLHKRVKINTDNFFSFDNVVLLEGDAIQTGIRNIEIRRTGSGPVYFNAYLTNFSQEDPITAAGLEVKVRRKFYRLKRSDRAALARGDRGQTVRQQTTRWKRIPLENLEQVNSGDLVEVELLINSKNDYEYLLLEDHKPSGFEPDDQRSGYINEGLRAYRELRDDRVSFFLSQLARGNHSISYRLRAETPGRVAALPARIEGMYAPELVGNSDEFKLQITEMPEKQE